MRHDHCMQATTTGLKCRFATGKATMAGQDDDTSWKNWAEAHRRCPSHRRRTPSKRWRFWMLSMAWNASMTAFFRGNAIAALMSQNDVPAHLLICGGKIGKYGGTSCRNRRQKGGNAQIAEKTFPVYFN